MLKRKEIISRLLATTMVLSTVTSGVSALEPRATVSSSTLAGADRYETAVKVSESGWTSATNAVIINGDKGLVDALTATPYASLKNAPILVTEKDKLTKVTKDRLTKLGVKNVDIVGGEAVVSQAVENELKAMGLKVNRIKGEDRYSTSVAVANEIKKLTTVNKIAVVNGATGLPDAVSIAAPAADNKMPIILSDPANNNGISEAKSFIESNNISKSYVIGQTSAVSNNIMNTLPGTKTRLGGSDRHETNAQVIKEFYTQKELDNIYVAKSGYIKNNEELVDALAVGVLAAKNDDPVLIVGKTLDATQETLLKEKNFDKITQVGGGIPQGSIDAIKATQSSTKEVKTVAELKTALSSARSGDVINFRPSSTISTTVDISSTTNVTVNLYNTYTSTVNVDLPNGTVNVYGTISGKLSVNDANKVAVQSSAKVTTLDIKSGAKDLAIDNKGTVTTLDVAATGVSINNSGTITTLNKLSDTTVDGNGTIGNMPVDTSKPVSQVIVENGKEITIRFSQSIDSVPSIVNITKGSSSSADITGFTKKLHDDKKTMTIIANSGEIFKGNYDLVIDGIVANGSKLDKYTTTFTAAKDEKAPQVTNVAFNQDNNKIEITLSEPIDSKDDAILRLNEVSKEASIDAISNPTNKITLDRPSDIALGTNVKIYLAGIKDASGNTMESYNGTLTLTKVDLTISAVNQIATDKIRITFNKKLPTSQTITTSEIKVYKSGDKNKTQLVTGVSSLNSDGKSFDITVKDDSIFTGTTVSQSVYVELAADACMDNTGVKNKAISKSLTLTKDTVKPTVKSTVLNSAKNGLEVTLSEDISIANSSGIKLKKNGVDLDTKVELKANTKNVIVVTTTDGDFLEDNKLKAGSYRVYIPSGALKDLSGNGIDAVNTSEIVVNSTEPTKKPVELEITQVGLKPNMFKVTTSSTVKVEGKDTVFKYSSDLYKHFSIDGKVIPSNSNVEFTGHDYKAIIVELPDDYIKSTGKAQLTVSGLQVESGRTVNSKTQTINVRDNVKPTLEKVEVVTVKDKTTKNIEEYQIKLTFDEAIKLNGEGSTLEKLLSKVKISTGKTEFNGKGENIACAYKLSGAKQVTITIKPDAVKSSNWTTVLTGSSTTIFEITSDIDIITDTDDNNGRTPLPVRKGTKLNIVKSSTTK